MLRSPRKTAPAVRDGAVQKKNRHELTRSYWNTPSEAPVFDRERPGAGYRHLLTTQEAIDFALLLPEWDRLAQGLDAVLLAAGGDADGWYDDGVIGICAWSRRLEVEWSRRHVEEHRSILERLDVPIKLTGQGAVCSFTEKTAKGFQLLHVFMHELGHHWDRINTRTRRGSPRGERFAESYAVAHEALIWRQYCRTFNL